ncbi:hypothetical protein DLH72_03630 [Candidatus Gracilibacteria bacterium]|nr:MAG: hypothetical protein DLH72_03630 [Candidatus Gracilibacteria bacterium]
MFKIFIPTEIFDDFSLNFLNENNLKSLANNFENLKITDFHTKYISGKILENPLYDEDLIIFANGEYGKKYFYDADFTQENIPAFGYYFYKDNGYFSELKNIEKEIFEIKRILESKNLLTKSKKEMFLDRIIWIFFLLSGMYFNIFTLLEKTNQNIRELQNIDGKPEFEGTVELIIEAAKTKKIELESSLQSFENHISSFYEIIKKYFLS